MSGIDYEKQFEEFFDGYVAAALWSSTDTHPESGDDVELDKFEEADSLRENLKPSAYNFFMKHYSLLSLYLEEREGVKTAECSEWELAGHDFWLNRNGHGTGFWDRGSRVGNQLADLVGWETDYPEINLYLGDDLHVYCTLLIC